MLQFVPNVPGPIYSSTLSHLALGAELWNTSRGFLVLQLLAGFSLVGGPGSRLEGTEGKGRRGLLTLSFLSEERGFPGGSDSTKTRRAKSLQSCPTLWDSMDLSLPGSSVHSPDKNTGVDCHALFQGIFPTQGSYPQSLMSACIGRQVLYH